LRSSSEPLGTTSNELTVAQAGVVISDYATLMVEVLADNGKPEAGAVYAALDMPWAVLVGQVAAAYSKKRKQTKMSGSRPGRLFGLLPCQRTTGSRRFRARSFLAVSITSRLQS
jgi:hypothetical protein